ncbi:hypothetical protein NECID01_1710 [Nematocida sp. AWRm77]|nr:hypothetical protein NECID01_1710 [Nematocida sp. AWRm77]
MLPSGPLADPEHRETKALSYASMIAEAIQASPLGRCTVEDVFRHVHQHHGEALVRVERSAWQNSIRQTLSKDGRFIKLKRHKSSRFCEWIFFPVYGDEDGTP